MYTQLYPGDTFGSLEGGQDVMFKNTYPMYMSSETCTLLRITKVDYNRVLQASVDNYQQLELQLATFIGGFEDLYSASVSLTTTLLCVSHCGYCIFKLECGLQF